MREKFNFGVKKNLSTNSVNSNTTLTQRNGKSWGKNSYDISRIPIDVTKINKLCLIIKTKENVLVKTKQHHLALHRSNIVIMNTSVRQKGRQYKNKKRNAPPLTSEVKRKLHIILKFT